MSSFKRTDIHYWIASIVVILLPCLPMLDLHSVFAVDWPNQVWLINYAASYLAAHHQFSAVINSDRLIGMPYPIFYGYLFFPTMAVLSIAWNADLTVRVVTSVMIAMKFFLVFRLGLITTANRLFGFCLATLVTWAIYPLTNLYNRGAIPEFFATNLLVCAAVIWLFTLSTKETLKRFLFSNLFVFLLVLSAGGHPITALYGGCFIVILVLVSILIHRADFRLFVIPLALPLMLGATVLAPWVIATVRFSPQMAIAASFKNVGYYPHSLDSLYGRLMPFPLETKSYKHKLHDDHAVTPHLDAQINCPLFLLFVFCCLAVFRSGGFKDRRILFSVSLFAVLTVVLIWMSVTRGAIDKLGHTFRTIQFAYRLVTYINFSLLLGIIFCSARRATERKVKVDRRLLLLLVVLSFVGLSVKLVNVHQAMVPSSAEIARTPEFTRSLLKMPDSFYGADAYTIVNLFRELNPEEVKMARNCPFQPSGNNFGDVDSIATPVGFTQTNIDQFPWNFVYQEENPLERLEHDHRIALNMPSSERVHYEFIPDSGWEAARLLSLSILFLWALVTIISCTFFKFRVLSNHDEYIVPH